MCRLIAFLHAAHEDLELTKGISSAEEPDLWQRDLTGNIVHWIELGMPDEKRIRQASGKAQQVSVYTYQDNKADLWLEKNRTSLSTNKKVKVFHISIEGEVALEKLLLKTINLSCIIEEEQMHLSDAEHLIKVHITQSF